MPVLRTPTVALVVLVGWGCGARIQRQDDPNGHGTEAEERDARPDRPFDSGPGDPCTVPDGDGDGYDSIECGGDDCNDENPSIYPGAPGDPWPVEVIGIGRAPSIAVDDRGTVHVACAKGGALYYVTGTSGDWRVEWLDAVDRQVLATSIALGADGTVHLVYTRTSREGIYYRDSRAVLYYTTRCHDGWRGDCADDEEPVSDKRLESEGAIDPQLVMDRAGAVHVAYFHKPSSALRYVTNASGEWETETVDAEGDVGEYPGLALDPAGLPRFSYWYGDESDLRYARGREDGWEMETIAHEGSTGWFTSIDVSSSGTPHIAYFDRTASEVRLATGGLDGWAVETIDPNAPACRATSLVLDAEEEPHVAYYSGQDLVHATRDAAGGGWVTEIASSDDGNFEMDFALGPWGEAHFVYGDGPSVRYVWHDLLTDWDCGKDE